MIEFLEMCGFKPEETASCLPRIEKAFAKCGIGTPEIKKGKERITRYYDINLEGVRGIFRLIILEFVNTILAREDGKKKIIFSFMAPGFEPIGSALASRSSEVFCANLCWSALVVLGSIFGRLVPVLEAAENRWLKAGGVAHCGNIKSLTGLFTLGILPKPDLLLTSGYSCEISPKNVDLLHEFHDIPAACYDTCQDKEIDDYMEASGRSITFAAKGLRSLVGRIGEIVGFDITDEMLWEAINARTRLNDATARLRKLIEESDPIPLSPTHDQLLIAINTLTLDYDGFPEAVNILDTLLEELEARASRGLGVMPKGAPRVLTILPPHHSDPRLEHLATEMGIALVASDFDFITPTDDAPNDPYQVISMHLMSSLAASLSKRVQMIAEGCRRLNINGVLNRYHVGCRSVSGDAMIINNALTKELGIPALLMEWENFDPRAYKHEQYKQRLEVFKNMMDANKDNINKELS
jgi:hypothetical protein